LLENPVSGGLPVFSLDLPLQQLQLSFLASGIDLGQGINVGPGKFSKKNKRRALNTQVL
jgi:hypothetical protein